MLTTSKVEETLAETLVEYKPFSWLSGRLQAFALGAASMIALPNITDKSNAIKTLQSEAEHFRRGIRMSSCSITSFATATDVSFSRKFQVLGYRVGDPGAEGPRETQLRDHSTCLVSLP